MIKAEIHTHSQQTVSIQTSTRAVYHYQLGKKEHSKWTRQQEKRIMAACFPACKSLQSCIYVIFHIISSFIVVMLYVLIFLHMYIYIYIKFPCSIKGQKTEGLPFSSISAPLFLFLLFFVLFLFIMLKPCGDIIQLVKYFLSQNCSLSPAVS